MTAGEGHLPVASGWVHPTLTDAHVIASNDWHQWRGHGASTYQRPLPLALLRRCIPRRLVSAGARALSLSEGPHAAVASGWVHPLSTEATRARGLSLPEASPSRVGPPDLTGVRGWGPGGPLFFARTLHSHHTLHDVCPDIICVWCSFHSHNARSHSLTPEVCPDLGCERVFTRSHNVRSHHTLREAQGLTCVWCSHTHTAGSALLPTNLWYRVPSHSRYLGL